MPQGYQVAILTPWTDGAGAFYVLPSSTLWHWAQWSTSFAERQDQAGLECGEHSRIRSDDFHLVKMQERGWVNNLRRGTTALWS
jgi:hypothetical protein